MIPLTHHDLAILFAMPGTRPQIEADVSDRYPPGDITLPEFKRRLYRLSRHGLCLSYTLNAGAIQWALSLAGEAIVEAVDGTDWDNQDFVYEYRKENR